MRSHEPFVFQVLDHAQDFVITENGHTYDVTPNFDHEGDSGRRLYVLQDTWLKPFEPTLIPHGIAVRPRPDYETQIRPRSSALTKRRIHVAFGTIDRSYGGELASSVMYIPSLEEIVRRDGTPSLPPLPVLLKRGERVSQLVEVAIIPGHADDVPERVDQLPETSRGAGGWGSTGGHTVTF